jgi:ADP-heptose:LPS heptosyltransferase
MEQGTGSLEPTGAPRVLVVRGGAIGDFILTLPAIRLIRQSIPGCHLEVIGYPGIAELAVKAGLAEAVRNFEHRTMAPLFAVGAPIDEELAGYLRSFNLVVSYLYDPDSHFRNSLLRVGVKTLIECPHRVEPGKGHAAAQLAKPLEALAMFLEKEDLELPLFPPASPRQGSPAVVAIHPGSGSLSKNWPLENWVDLGKRIITRLPDTRLVLITGEAEAERGTTAAVQNAWQSLPYEHWEGVPLRDLADRLRECTVFLGHDSGSSHLAGACGVPSVLLFGPTDPTLWAPPQPVVRVIQAPDGDLTRITQDGVLEVLEEVLSSLKGTGSHTVGL